VVTAAAATATASSTAMRTAAAGARRPHAATPGVADPAAFSATGGTSATFPSRRAKTGVQAGVS
jgi:hypothetical protein